MKEIKYRQIKDGITHYWGYIEGVFITPMTTSEWHDVPSERYIGILDDLGNDIYEGDITINGSLIITGHELGSVVIKRKFGKDEIIIHEIWEDEEIRIIGNITNNPELYFSPKVYKGIDN